MKSPYFTEEHALFRESLRAFFDRELRPQVDSWEAQRQIPRAVWQRMGAEGYLGLWHREADGGLAADFFTTVVYLEELGRLGNGGFATAMSVHSYMATNHLAKAGSAALRARYLQPALAGDMIAALGISEPAAGSDVASLRTTARREGDHYVIDGAKNFISNGYYADFIVTAAQTPEGMSLLVVPGDSPGLRRTKLDKIGWHSSDTAEIGYDGVRVPVDHLIGQPGMGFKYLMDSFQLERLVAGLLAVGGMEGTLALTLRYMAERAAFGRPINKFQALRHRIAGLATEIEACKQLVHHTAWRFAQGDYVVKECSMVKLHASELANKVVDRCLQMFGGYGYVEDFPIARAYRDARVGTIAGGTSEIMKEIIAKMVIDGVHYEQAYETGEAAPGPAAAEVIGSIAARFRPDKAGDYATCVHYDLQGPGGGAWTIVIGGGQCTVTAGHAGQAACVIRAEAATYVDLELGRLDPQQALMSGQVQVSDLGEMMRFTRCFARYRPQPA